LAGADVGAQTRQILKSFIVMLDAVGSDLSHVTHINIFLQHMSDFEAMNAAYVEIMGDRRPARTVVSVGNCQARRIVDDESYCGDEGAIRIVRQERMIET